MEDIYRGGNSKSRNPHMQTMLRMIGFGDNAGSGFPSILAAWKMEGWIEPELIENTALNQVTLILKMVAEDNDGAAESAEKSAESAEKSAESYLQNLSDKQRHILGLMEIEIPYSTEEIAAKMGMKRSRTRQLLNELVSMGLLVCTAATKNRRYVRISNLK